MTKRPHQAAQTFLLLASVAFPAGSYGGPGSLLSSDGTFDSGQEDFGTYLPNNSALASFDGEANFDIQAVQENEWEVQFSHAGFAVTQGDTYTLCFSAKAAANRTLTTYIDANGTPNYNNIVTGDTQVSLSTTYQDYAYTFTANQTDDSARLVFNMGLNGASVQLDNINVYEGATCGVEPTDGDSDGVLDNEDLCPSTPPNTPVDPDGCPIPVSETFQIETENYVAASDTSSGNSGAPTQCAYNGLDVDIENTSDTGAGCNLGWIDAGEWVEYDLSLPAGVYEVSARVASDLTGGTFSVLIDNSDVALGTVSNTGGWQTWETISLGSVTVGSGAQTLRLEMNAAGFNINWLLFEPSDTVADSDTDGVNDNEDQCPATPVGATVDASGCPLDTDGDGVFDGLDQCASTPEGAFTDTNGCPLDSDDDGIYDGLDQCPQTAPGQMVDANGCAIPVDTDGDGVNDATDTCPATPVGAIVDASGCPLDSDGDGVYDGLDQCPMTSPGASVDAQGCPVASDADNDGIDDAIDQCPATPAGATVDASGCPLDSDGDGVFDGLDQCPASPASVTVDANGCPLPQDSDGDGVFDEDDNCPGTPPGVSVDALGCEVTTPTELFIEAESYTAAVDNSAGNEGAAGDCVYNGLDVDVEDTLDTGGGCNVGWIDPGEWLEYPVNLAAGAYTLSARVATNAANGSFTVLIDDTEVATTTLPATGGWQEWETITVGDLNLSSGPHTLRIEMNTSGFNLNWISLEPAGAPVDSDGDGVIDADDLCPQTPFGAMVDLDGCELVSNFRIEAETYSAASDNTAGNSGAPTQCDYNGLEVDVENALDVGDGCNVGWIDAGEWLEYTFELAQGTYALTARVAAAQGGGAYTLLIDGEPLFNQSVASTEGWQTWITQTLGDVTLTGGSHTLRIEMDAPGFNINWLEFTHSSMSPDSDGDGVNDDIDLCPDTPVGAQTDTNGCPLDQDGDGVFDGLDQCPQTPPGSAVDANGCTLVADTDGDGVADADDQCPGTPAGTPVDAVGCALPQDSDGDGVFDAADQCPGTPAGTPVDAVGCALPQDSDGDGVFDAADQCPGTPAGTPVDAAGCPLPTDSDNDGVVDSQDQCPNTAPGATVDANGCETTANVPIRIEAENYTAAGDTTPGNEGEVTQCAYNGLDADVEDALDSEGNCNLGWIEAGEWVEYALPASAGRYLVSIRVAADNDGGAFTLSVDGDLLTTHTVTSTGGWQTWQTQTLGEMDIPAGAQTLRMDVDVSWFNLNWLEFTPIEFNDTDTDGDGVFDSVDQCPGTPVNTPVNAAGCELGTVPPWIGAPPAMSDFQTIPLAVGINLPMQLEISKAGDLYVIGRLGHFYAFENGELVEKSIIATNSFEEGGLIGMALDPNFLTNRYAYFHYTDATDPVHHISRIPINADNTLNFSAESILLSYGVQQESCCHMGGAMVFDTLGNLYISTGDNTDTYSSDDFTPIDERPNHSPQDAQKSSGNTNDLRGKIIRITPTADGSYTVPQGNLFAPDALHREEIFIMGNRNPFRIAIDSETNWLYWADIGPNAGAGDPNRGPAGYDEINRTNQAGNYGWPYFAGNNEPYVDYDFATGISGAPFDPNNVVNDSPNNTGAFNLPDAQAPWYVMSHRATMLAGIYRWDDSIDDPFKLPSYFHGRLIYWNFNNDEIFETDVSQNTAQPRLWLDNDLVGGIIDGEISAHNNRLYMLAYGANCCSSPPYAGVLMEVRYTGTGPDVVTPKTYYAVNVAGEAYLGVNGTEYEPHNYVYEGNLQTVATAIANTEDDTLYQNQVWLDGDLNFEFPVEDGTYDVQVQMADIYFDVPGERSFHIDLEGQRVVADLDIVAEVGANTAYDRYFTTTVNDGILNLDFIQSVENPTVAGIVIRKQGDYTPGSTIVIKASNGQFVTTSSPPVANSASVSNNEIFAIESTGNGSIALRSVATDLYLGQTGSGAVTLNATTIGPDQSFNLVEAPDGSYVIRTIDGQYVSAGSGGTLQLVAALTSTTTFSLHLADVCDPDPSYGLSCRPFAEPYLEMPVDAASDLSNIPTLLSQTGTFADVSNLTPVSSFVPFEPISPLWSDRAVKSRWVSVPSGKRVGFQDSGKWQWPEGTVFLKHFALPIDESDPSNLRRLETRITVIQPGGTLYGVTYKWRADGSDADLLTTVLNEDITISSPAGDWTQTWTYPSPNDCLTCHNEDAEGVLGPKTAALNKEWLYPNGVTTNQLATWNHLGLFDQVLDEGALNTLPAHAHISDTTKTLEHRVRSYWDTNCAQCHGPQGIAANWDARFETPLAEQGVVLGAVAEHRDYLALYGLANPFVVDPGNPGNSILFIRDQSVDPDDRMPPLGRNLEDVEYMDVLEQWINSLTP